jgi:hypothetical protein
VGSRAAAPAATYNAATNRTTAAHTAFILLRTASDLPQPPFDSGSILKEEA